MKKQTLSKIENPVRKIFLSLILFIGLVPALNAQENTQTVPRIVDIRYLGTIEDQPVFQVEFENTNAEKVSVRILDEDGVLLYGITSKDKKFSKKFRFDKSGSEPLKINFNITSEKEKHSQHFEINRNFRMVQDVSVTRL